MAGDSNPIVLPWLLGTWCKVALCLGGNQGPSGAAKGWGCGWDLRAHVLNQDIYLSVTEALAKQRSLPQQDLEGKEVLKLEPFSNELPSNWEPSQLSEMVHAGLSTYLAWP